MLPPVEQRIVTVQRDSVVLRDSVVITPIEQSSAVVLPKDTLLLETSLAKAEAYVSEDGLLKGNITNKKSIVEQIKWKERTVVQIDSVYVEKPVEVEVQIKVVPKWCWCLLSLFIALVVVTGLRIYLKMKLL